MFEWTYKVVSFCEGVDEEKLYILKEVKLYKDYSLAMEEYDNKVWDFTCTNRVGVKDAYVRVEQFIDEDSDNVTLLTWSN